MDVVNGAVVTGHVMVRAVPTSARAWVTWQGLCRMVKSQDDEEGQRAIPDYCRAGRLSLMGTEVTELRVNETDSENRSPTTEKTSPGAGGPR